MQHLKDYVWMQLGEEPPIQVPTDQQSLTEKLCAGYRQVDEPASDTAEPAKAPKAKDKGAK